MFELLLIAACTVLNRLRGTTGWKPAWLKVRSLYLVSPVIGLLMWALSGDYILGAGFALGYFFWGLFSWGFILARLGAKLPSRPQTQLESLLDFEPYWLGAYIRMSFVLPLVAFVVWYTRSELYGIAAVAFPALTVFTYWALMRELEDDDWPTAELITGSIWGLMIVAAANAQV